MFWILPAILPLIGLRSESVVAAQKVNRSPKPTFNTQEIGKEDIFYSSHASRGFRAQLGVFLSDLDPSGKMANENYYPQKDHQVHKIEGKLHWSYIEVISITLLCRSSSLFLISVIIMDLIFTVAWKEFVNWNLKGITVSY